VYVRFFSHIMLYFFPLFQSFDKTKMLTSWYVCSVTVISNQGVKNLFKEEGF